MAQLSSQQWINDIVVTKRTIGGKTYYFPRNQSTLKRLYKIDTTLCGFQKHNLPKRAVIVDPNDEIIK